ncbi:glycosyltransferase family 39 protein [Thermococcus sp.]|uniref:ArnT family glycosyltransferase n=2 Tax=Thermococcus sp. TaxID=35749 RepID=UPI0025D706E2|nr:glycosyltransferase family 39 protein [Thermococcus sp.]
MRKFSFYLLLICFLTLIIRFPLLPVMNSYVDYDEGTYLLIARLINHGVLPYRDIFAVHPPLYYYTLAGWLRLFGDNYIVGRAFSLFLGLISVFLAYLTGRELTGEKLGLAFAFLIAMDPLAIKVNTLVLHESMIEFFTLLSLWFLAKYLNEKRRLYAYLTIIIASIGTSTKFTMIPYLLAVFVFLVLYESEELRNLILSGTKVLTRRQSYIIPLTYLLWTMISMAAITLYPQEVTRIIASVPGIHPITKVGHVYTCILFLFLWVFLTVYVINIKYLQPLQHALKELKGVINYGAVLISLVIISKALIEVPLGVLVSPDYVYQTYIAQSSRGYPFVGIFWIIGNILSNIQKSSLELLAYYAPLIVLVATVLIIKAFGNKIKFSEPLKALFFLNVIFYLIAVPIIPNPRFIYPLLLVSYLYLLSGVVEIKQLEIKILGITMTLILLLTLINVGIAYNYPKGALRIACAPHTKELRNDLSNYVHKEALNGTYLSINPMDAYYLKLKVVPYMVDTFGLGYLRKYNLVNIAREYSPDYVIYDTWMFNMMKNKPLQRVYGLLFNYTLQNGTLLFGESLKDGEIIALFSFKKPTYPWRVNLHRVSLYVYYNMTKININFNLSPQLLKLFRNNNESSLYNILAITNNKTIHGEIVLSNNSINVSLPANVISTITISKGIILHEGVPIDRGSVNNVILCTPKICFLFTGKIDVSENKILVRGPFQIMVQKKV